MYFKHFNAFKFKFKRIKLLYRKRLKSSPPFSYMYLIHKWSTCMKKGCTTIQMLTVIFTKIIFVYRVCKCNVFWQIIPRVCHSVEKEVCSWLVFSCTPSGELEGLLLLYFDLVSVFYFHRTSLFSQDRVQSCKSE